MNYRTLTDNPQATELIAAVKDLKPVKQQDKYQGSMEYIAADNASYCQLIAKYGPGQEPPLINQTFDLSPYVAFMIGILLVLLIIKGFCRTSKK